MRDGESRVTNLKSHFSGRVSEPSDNKSKTEKLFNFSFDSIFPSFPCVCRVLIVVIFFPTTEQQFHLESASTTATANEIRKKAENLLSNKKKEKRKLAHDFL
jgi:hypothetical protein